MAGEKLTTAQLRELENLYTQKTVWVGSITPKRLVNTLNKLIEYGYAQKSDRAVGADVTLTPDGMQLAATLFGNSTPDPDGSEPLPDDAPVVAENAPAEEASETAHIFGFHDGNIWGVKTVCATPVDPQPVSRVQWHETRLRFADTVNIEGYKLSKSRAIAPSCDLAANKVMMGIRLPNMARGGKKSDTRALTPMSRRGKPLTPAIPMKAWRRQHQMMQLAQLGILLGDTDNIVSIVSHIETPLTGQTRRVA